MNGKKEIEIVFYAEIGDFTGFSKAHSFEEHDQLTARLPDGSSIRIRKTLKSDATTPTYTLTTKVKQAEGGSLVASSTEYNADVNEEAFKAFEAIAEQRIVKTRYYFLNQSITLAMNDTIDRLGLDNVGFEVDVFKLNGKVSNWVKIDVEIDPILDHLNKHCAEIKNFRFRVKTKNLAFQPGKIIFPKIATDEQKAFLDQLWATEFSTQREPASAP